jgi:hypothetical protein
MQWIYSTAEDSEYPAVCFCLAHLPMLLYEHIYLFLLCFSVFFLIRNLIVMCNLSLLLNMRVQYTLYTSTVLFYLGCDVLI